MAAAKPLRAVRADETVARAKRTVLEAAESGDHRALLVAMRERIARAVQAADCPPRDLAALTRRLQDIAKEIESLDLRSAEDDASRKAEVEDGEFDASAV